MPRAPRYTDHTTARLPEGTLAMLDRVLKPNETRADAIRAAVAELVARRVGEG